MSVAEPLVQAVTLSRTAVTGNEREPVVSAVCAPIPVTAFQTPEAGTYPVAWTSSKVYSTE